MTNVEYMNIINDFLKNPIIPEVKEDIIVSDKELASINDLFASNDVPVNYLHLRPKIKENQIWTIKRSYMDYEGILQSAAAPIMVLLVSQEEMIGEDGMFVRVCPISPFVEMASENDQICEEESITGFPFFIERWNEQPILTEILDKYVGDYYEHMPFFIEVRKKKAEFILTIIPKVEVVLRNLENKQIEGTSNSERIVYGGLRKGLYQIESPLLNKTITIRLK